MRNCAFCGEPFEPRRSDQIYCSHKHRTYASRARRRAADAKLKTALAMVERLRAIAPSAARSYAKFVDDYGPECAEAAIRLCLTAYTEGHKRHFDQPQNVC